MLLLLPKIANSCNEVFAIAFQTGVLGIFPIFCEPDDASIVAKGYDASFGEVFGY